MSETQTVVTAEPAVGPAKPDAPRRPSLWPLLMAYLWLLALSVGAAYWHHHILPANESATEERLEAAERAPRDLKAGLESVRLELAETVRAQQTQQQALVTVQQDQDAVAAQLAELRPEHEAAAVDWILAEVEYLILAATQRLALEQDAATAGAALHAADLRLKGGREPAFLPLREQLARDIASLQSVDTADVEGLALSLAEAIAQADALPTREIDGLHGVAAESTTPGAGSTDWQALLLTLWQDLKSLVEVKDGELSDGALFDPKLRYVLQQNLKLELASARLAVLRRDNANFRASARLVGQLLNDYYDTGSAAVRALSAQMQAAERIDLRPALPDVSASLDRVRELRARQPGDGGGALR